jgi:hypothetical protein
MPVPHAGNVPSQPPHVQAADLLVRGAVNLAVHSLGGSKSPGAHDMTNPNKITAPNDTNPQTRDSKYGQPNTFDRDENCAVVSTARILLNPTTKLPYTTQDALAFIQGKPIAKFFLNPDIDSKKTDAECRLLCEIFNDKTRKVVYQSFKPPLRLKDISELDIPPPSRQADPKGFVICYDTGANNLDHAVNGSWNGEKDAPDWRFTDWQTSRIGEDVTYTVTARPITGIWWYKKPEVS